MYEMVRKHGIDPEIASVVAQGAAVPYALIEGVQVSRIIPGMKKLKDGLVEEAFRRMVASKAVREALTKAGVGAAGREAAAQGVRLLTAFTREVTEEVAQELTQVSAEEMGKQLNKAMISPALSAVPTAEASAPLPEGLVPAGGAGGPALLPGQAPGGGTAQAETPVGDESLPGAGSPVGGTPTAL